MKPDHVPFKLVCYWEELLEKYTDAPEDDRERDEPVLMFQRNAFFKRSEEQNLESAKLLYLLYHEAKEAVVDGRCVPAMGGGGGGRRRGRVEEGEEQMGERVLNCCICCTTKLKRPSWMGGGLH